MLFLRIFIFSLFPWLCMASVKTGLDLFFEKKIYENYCGKKIGIITNHTGRNSEGKSLLDLFDEKKELRVIALFSPEHGMGGNVQAGVEVPSLCSTGRPVYSLYGKTRRPTEEMLQGIDVLIYDIQDLGTRSYTYATTLFFVMEEAAKRKIEVIVLDRPNPLGGKIVDGPMLQEEMRSFIGYINVPYCHGMTIGELALLFNERYEVHCALKVIPMEGWHRGMLYKETGLQWIPPSPQIPDAETAFFYPATGILGELKLVSIGVGYTLPFRVIGAPWIDAEVFAKKLNEQKIKGVRFIPFHFSPFHGFFAEELCHGVLVQVTDPNVFHPVTVQYLILGILKSLYPEKILSHLSQNSCDMFSKANGTKEVIDLLGKEKYPSWKLMALHEKERKEFLKIRKKYLLPVYE